MKIIHQLGHGAFAAGIYLLFAFGLDFLVVQFASVSPGAVFWTHFLAAATVSIVYFMRGKRTLHAGPLFMAIIAVVVDLVLFTPGTAFTVGASVIVLQRVISIALPAILGGYLGLTFAKE
jgi:hypothetical protein